MQKADVVLIRAYGKDEGFKVLPFGILDITAYLEKFGFTAKIIDRHKHKTQFFTTFKEIVSWKPAFIGISAMTSQADDALKLGRYIKRHSKTRLIYGGLHFTVLPEEGLNIADIVVRGEGENALLEILNNDNSPKGIYTAKTIADLDLIPLPKEGLLKFLAWGKGAFTILTSRGCPYNCSFCLDKKYRDIHIRYHSVEYVLDYIELIKRTLDINDFFIADDIFTVNAKRVFDFCEGLNKRNLKAKLSCFSRSGINNIAMYKAMKQAGFYNIDIGVESGNNEVLKAINKQQTVEEARETISIIKQAGLEVSANFIIGNISETEKTIRDTINFAQGLSLLGWYVAYAQPFPGSRFYETAEKYGTLINKDPKTYRTDKISFLPKGLSRLKLKKLQREFIRTMSPRIPWFKKILNKWRVSKII